ncbi:MAG: hypothetical protein NTW41_12530 [Verrucomicrobia bacterium]|nr:hypothetical protein [Verrucomicrobiota bacterium]
MRSNIITSEKKERSMTSIYLRCDLKSFAREASCRNGQPLTRYIESLLVGELTAVNGVDAKRAISATPRDAQSPKASTPDHQNPAL